LDEEAARSVLSVAETLVDDLASDTVEESRAAYDRFLQAHGGSPPQPLETDSAPSIISDLDTLPTLSGLAPEDVEVSKEGESGMLVSLPITMIPDDLQPEDTKSCLVDYHALVDAGMPPQLDLEAILQEFRRIDMEPVMNKTDSGIEWAALSLSPVTGCRHGCDFCYARDIANRFYPQGFTPTFYPERLLAIRDATLPNRAEDDWRYRNVFISSMGDLFGGWIPKFMIEAVLDEIEERDEDTFSFLTKYAKRLPEFDFPDNAWVGTSVISQNWVSLAEEAFADVDAENTWISAEPLKSDLEFDHLDRFDWVVYGAQTAASGEPAEQPAWKWVEHLREQAREAGCNLFQKENLAVRPMESPHEKCDSTTMPELWD
jgi:protein gp37